MNKKLLVLLIAVTAAVAGVFIWHKFIREEEIDPKDYIESYLVLDLHGTPEWLASHSTTVTWKDKPYTLPVAFKISETSPTNEPLIGFKIPENGKAILTIAGHPVHIVSIPTDEINVWGQGSVLVDNVAGRSANIVFLVFVPKGCDRDSYERPGENKLRSLLTSHNTYNLTQKDWPQTSEKLADFPE